MYDLPNFRQDQWLTPRLDEGMNGVVYGISDWYAAKVSVHVVKFGHNLRRRQTLNDPKSAISVQLAEEHKMAAELYQNDISVPKPQGIYRVDIRWFETAFGLYYPQKTAFVMEKINGIKSDKTKGDIRKKS